MMKGTSYLCILTAGALWGLNGLFYRLLTAYGFDSMQVTFSKLMIAAILLGGYYLMKSPGILRIRLKDFWTFTGAGALGLLLFNFCNYNAMGYTTVAVAISLLYTAPGFVLLLSALLFKEKITRRKLLALVLIFAGCACAAGLFTGKQTFTLIGVLWGLGAGFCNCLYTIFSRFALDRGYSSPTVTFYTVLMCAVCAAPFSHLESIGSNLLLPSCGLLLAISVITCLIPNSLFVMGLKKLEAGEAAMLATSEPVMAAVVSAVLLSEPISLFVVLGIALIVAGIIVMNKKVNPRQNRDLLLSAPGFPGACSEAVPPPGNFRAVVISFFVEWSL